MSYIPKYILKRMLPPDCVKEVKGGIEISVINVLSPLSIDEIPADYKNYLDYLELVVDGKPVPNEKKAGIKIVYNDKSYGMDNLTEAIGQTIPVGGSLKLFAPLDWLKKGEKHQIDINVKLDNPISIQIEREIQ